MKYHQSGQSDQGNKQPLTLNILGWGAGGGGGGGHLYYGGKSGETTFKVILYSKRKEGKSLKKNNNNNCQVFPCCYMGEFFFYKPWCHLFFAVPF